MLFNFIRITNETMLREVPYITALDINYDYDRRYEYFTIQVSFLDLNNNIKGFGWKYFKSRSVLSFESELSSEFTYYLNNFVKPLFRRE